MERVDKLLSLYGDRYSKKMLENMINDNKSDDDIDFMYYDGISYKAKMKAQEEAKRKEEEEYKRQYFAFKRKQAIDSIVSIIESKKNITRGINKVIRNSNGTITIIEVNGILKTYGYEPTLWSEHDRVRNGKNEIVREHYKNIIRVIN